VKKKAPKKLVRVQRHGAPTIPIGVVFPGEGDGVVVDGQDALIGYGDAVGISGEVLEDLAGATERRLCVDEPFFLAQGFEALLPRHGMLEFGEVSVEVECVSLERVNEHREKLASEHSAQDANGQEETVATGGPVLAVGTDAAAGDEAVQVGMDEKVLSPGMQEGDAADPGPEMLRIPRDRQESFGSGTKQHSVDGTAVLECQWRQLVREGEYDVEVLHVENLLLTGLEPGGTRRALTLRAMPVTARVVNAYDVPASVAPFGVTTEHRRLAVHEVRQDTTLFS
jgi:hypothetical protein